MATTEDIKEILLAENDADLRSTVATQLRRRGFKVRDIDSGAAAKALFDAATGEFSLVISASQMPDGDGLTLLNHVRQSSPIPFIILVGAGDTLDKKRALEAGASAFLAKPVQTSTLLDAIRDCLKLEDPTQNAAGNPADITERFFQVHITDFMADNSLQMDLYIRLSKSKFIKVAHKGDSISLERLNAYRSKKAEFLYFSLSDFKRYMDFSFDVVNHPSDLKGPEKVELLSHTAQVCTEVAFAENVDPETMQSAVSMATESVRMLSSADDINSLLKQLDTQMPSLYTHSVATSVLATLIAKQHGWTSPRTQVKAAMCALFHDIGKRDIDLALLTKERAKRTPAEVEIIESHAFRGRDILLATKSMPEEVAQVAFEHHETGNGTGYPMKASGPTILPISKLVHIADLFITLTMPMETGPQPMSAEDAINHIVTNHYDEVDHEFLKALGGVFNTSGSGSSRAHRAS